MCALYVIRPKRNKSVVLEIPGNVFNGILITDFWKPYFAVSARLRQWCIAHYLRGFIKVEDRRSNVPKSYLKFRRAVRRLFTEASMCKWYATEMQKRHTDECLQFFGGYGYMMEYPIARAFIDSRIQTIYAGTTEIMKEIIGRSLGL